MSEASPTFLRNYDSNAADRHVERDRKEDLAFRPVDCICYLAVTLPA